jgi:uncharacterized membrane-anchored protein
MGNVIVAVAAVILLAVVNWVIHARETLIDSGRALYLELAPLDPRSLLQGDYMALRFKAANDAFGRRRMEEVDGGGGNDGRLVLAVDSRGVADFRRLDDGSPLAADEALIRYRVRNGQPRLATNAFFFEEGHAADYAGARYGEFRVTPDGTAILTRLRDPELKVLGAAPRR